MNITTVSIADLLADLLEMLKRAVKHVIEHSSSPKAIIGELNDRIKEQEKLTTCIADVELENQDILQDVYDITTNVYNKLEKLEKSEPEELAVNLKDFLDKEMKELTNKLEIIKKDVVEKMETTANLTDSIALAFTGESVEIDENVDKNAPKFVGLYKDNSGNIIIALNDEGKLAGEIDNENYDMNHTKYYRMNEDQMIPIKTNDINLDDFVGELSYVGNDKQLLNDIIPKITNVSILKDNTCCIRIGELCALPTVDRSKSKIRKSESEEKIKLAKNLKEQLNSMVSDLNTENYKEELEKFKNSLNRLNPETAKVADIEYATEQAKKVIDDLIIYCENTDDFSEKVFKDDVDSNIKNIEFWLDTYESRYQANTQGDNDKTIIAFPKVFAMSVNEIKKETYIGSENKSAQILEDVLIDSFNHSKQNIHNLNVRQLSEKINKRKDLSDLIHSDIKEEDRIDGLGKIQSVYDNKSGTVKVYDTATKVMIAFDISNGEIDSYEGIENISVDLTDKKKIVVGEYNYQNKNSFEFNLKKAIDNHNVLQLFRTKYASAVIEAVTPYTRQEWHDTLDEALDKSVKVSEKDLNEREFLLKNITEQLKSDKFEDKDYRVSQLKSNGNIRIDTPEGNKFYINFDKKGLATISQNFKVKGINTPISISEGLGEKRTQSQQLYAFREAGISDVQLKNVLHECEICKAMIASAYQKYSEYNKEITNSKKNEQRKDSYER